MTALLEARHAQARRTPAFRVPRDVIAYNVNTKRRHGFVVYDGPSVLDPKTPIVAILRAPWSAKANTKLGIGVDALTIFLRDMKPSEAVRSGADAAVCGNCRLRPTNGGGCYVRMFPGPDSTHHAHTMNPYPRLEDPDAYRGRIIRMSEWGDAAAIPIEVWEDLRARLPALTWLAYTHQWRDLDVARWGWCMASVETEKAALEARAAGWRTFRARRPGSPKMEGEIVCPAAKEAVTSARMTCDFCRLCRGTEVKRRDGTLAASITLDAHGIYARYVSQENLRFGLRSKLRAGKT